MNQLRVILKFCLKKNNFLVIFALALSSHLQAQSVNYQADMISLISNLDSAKTSDNLQELAAEFEQVAAAEKTQWLPYYYASYASVLRSFQEKDIKIIDGLMDKSDRLLDTAAMLAKDNSEISLLKAMTVQCRMSADQSRYMTLGPKCSKLIKLAETQFPKENPRAYLMDAQMVYYFPEAFGGGKVKGIAIMEQAIAFFSSFKPETDLHPNWGKDYAAQTLKTWKNQP